MTLRVRIYVLIFFASLYFAFPIIAIKVNDALRLPEFDIRLWWFGVLLIMLGLILSGYCYWLFFKVGKGTPVPTQPTQRIIDKGPYKYTRNPIYVSHLLIHLGTFFIWPKVTLLGGFFMMIGFYYLFTILYEEPHTIARLGEEYRAYMKRVTRRIL